MPTPKNPPKKTLIIQILLISLIKLALSQLSLNSIHLQTYTENQQNIYTLHFSQPQSQPQSSIPQNSYIIIDFNLNYFPYVQTNTCQIVDWPYTVISLSCTITTFDSYYQIKVENLFTNSETFFTSNQKFSLKIGEIQNPKYQPYFNAVTKEQIEKANTYTIKAQFFNENNDLLFSASSDIEIKNDIFHDPEDGQYIQTLTSTRNQLRSYKYLTKNDLTSGLIISSTLDFGSKTNFRETYAVTNEYGRINANGFKQEFTLNIPNGINGCFYDNTFLLAQERKSSNAWFSFYHKFTSSGYNLVNQNYIGQSLTDLQKDEYLTNCYKKYNDGVIFSYVSVNKSAPIKYVIKFRLSVQSTFQNNVNLITQNAPIEITRLIVMSNGNVFLTWSYNIDKTISTEPSGIYYNLYKFVNLQSTTDFSLTYVFTQEQLLASDFNSPNIALLENDYIAIVYYSKTTYELGITIIEQNGQIYKSHQLLTIAQTEEQLYGTNPDVTAINQDYFLIVFAVQSSGNIMVLVYSQIDFTQVNFKTQINTYTGPLYVPQIAKIQGNLASLLTVTDQDTLSSGTLYYQTFQIFDCDGGERCLNTCYKSKENCQECIGDTSLSYARIPEQGCQCPIGYYDDFPTYQDCLPCHKFCDRCDDSSENCLTYKAVPYSFTIGDFSNSEICTYTAYFETNVYSGGSQELYLLTSCGDYVYIYDFYNGYIYSQLTFNGIKYVVALSGNQFAIIDDDALYVYNYQTSTSTTFATLNINQASSILQIYDYQNEKETNQVIIGFKNGEFKIYQIEDNGVISKPYYIKSQLEIKNIQQISGSNYIILQDIEGNLEIFDLLKNKSVTFYENQNFQQDGESYQMVYLKGTNQIITTFYSYFKIYQFWDDLKITEKIKIYYNEIQNMNPSYYDLKPIALEHHSGNFIIVSFKYTTEEQDYYNQFILDLQALNENYLSSSGNIRVIQEKFSQMNYPTFQIKQVKNRNLYITTTTEEIIIDGQCFFSCGDCQLLTGTLGECTSCNTEPFYTNKIAINGQQLTESITRTFQQSTKSCTCSSDCNYIDNQSQDCLLQDIVQCYQCCSEQICSTQTIFSQNCNPISENCENSYFISDYTCTTCQILFGNQCLSCNQNECLECEAGYLIPDCSPIECPENQYLLNNECYDCSPTINRYDFNGTCACGNYYEQISQNQIICQNIGSDFYNQQTLYDITHITSYIYLFIFAVSVALGQNAFYFLQIFELFQLIRYLSFMNINYPVLIHHYLKSFSGFNLEFLYQENYSRNAIDKNQNLNFEKSSFLTSPPGFKNNYIFGNMWDNTKFFVILGAALLFIYYALYFILFKFKLKKYKQTQKILLFIYNEYFKIEIWILFLLFAYQSFTVFGFVQIYSVNIDEISEVIIFVLNYCLLIFIHYKIFQYLITSFKILKQNDYQVQIYKKQEQKTNLNSVQPEKILQKDQQIDKNKDNLIQIKNQKSQQSEKNLQEISENQSEISKSSLSSSRIKHLPEYQQITSNYKKKQNLSLPREEQIQRPASDSNFQEKENSENSKQSQQNSKNLSSNENYRKNKSETNLPTNDINITDNQNQNINYYNNLNNENNQNISQILKTDNKNDTESLNPSNSSNNLETESKIQNDKNNGENINSEQLLNINTTVQKKKNNLENGEYNEDQIYLNDKNIVKKLILNETPEKQDQKDEIQQISQNQDNTSINLNENKESHRTSNSINKSQKFENSENNKNDENDENVENNKNTKNNQNNENDQNNENTENKENSKNSENSENNQNKNQSQLFQKPFQTVQNPQKDENLSQKSQKTDKVQQNQEIDLNHNQVQTIQIEKNNQQANKSPKKGPRLLQSNVIKINESKKNSQKKLKKNQNQQINEKNYSHFYKYFYYTNPNNTLRILQKHYLVILWLRKLYFAICLVFLNSVPFAATTFLIVGSVLYIILEAILKPYFTKIITIKNILSELFLIGFLGFCYRLITFKNNRSQQNQIIVGQIVFISLILLVNTLFFVYLFTDILKKKIKNIILQRLKNKQLQQQQKHKENSNKNSNQENQEGQENIQNQQENQDQNFIFLENIDTQQNQNQNLNLNQTQEDRNLNLNQQFQHNDKSYLNTQDLNQTEQMNIINNTQNNHTLLDESQKMDDSTELHRIIRFGANKKLHEINEKDEVEESSVKIKDEQEESNYLDNQLQYEIQNSQKQQQQQEEQGQQETQKTDQNEFLEEIENLEEEKQIDGKKKEISNKNNQNDKQIEFQQQNQISQGDDEIQNIHENSQNLEKQNVIKTQEHETKSQEIINEPKKIEKRNQFSQQSKRRSHLQQDKIKKINDQSKNSTETQENNDKIEQKEQYIIKQENNQQILNQNLNQNQDQSQNLIQNQNQSQNLNQNQVENQNQNQNQIQNQDQKQSLFNQKQQIPLINNNINQQQQEKNETQTQNSNEKSNDNNENQTNNNNQNKSNIFKNQKDQQNPQLNPQSIAYNKTIINNNEDYQSEIMNQLSMYSGFDQSIDFKGQNDFFQQQKLQKTQNKNILNNLRKTTDLQPLNTTISKIQRNSNVNKSNNFTNFNFDLNHDNYQPILKNQNKTIDISDNFQLQKKNDSVGKTQDYFNNNNENDLQFIQNTQKIEKNNYINTNSNYRKNRQNRKIKYDLDLEEK